MNVCGPHVLVVYPVRMQPVSVNDPVRATASLIQCIQLYRAKHELKRSLEKKQNETVAWMTDVLPQILKHSSSAISDIFQEHATTVLCADSHTVALFHDALTKARYDAQCRGRNVPPWNSVHDWLKCEQFIGHLHAILQKQPHWSLHQVHVTCNHGTQGAAVQCELVLEDADGMHFVHSIALL